MAIEWKKVAYFDDIKDASTTVKGIVELATDAETQTGTATTLVITPANLSARTATETRTGVAELATSAEAIAGTDTSRIVTPAGNAASEAVIKNPLQMAQGVEMTYAASGSTGIMVADNDNIDFGTGNFTLVWKGTIPDYTPAADTILMQKSDSTNGWALQVDTTGVLQLILNTTTYSSTVNPFLTDKTAHKIIVVVTRETVSVAGSIVFYVDGVLLGVSVAITAGAPTTVSNAVMLYVLGTSAIRSAGTCYFASVFNRALTAAEVLDLYRNGINFADKWGSQTEMQTATWRKGGGSYAPDTLDGASASGFHVIDDGTDCRAVGTDSLTFVYGKKYRVSYDVTVASGVTPKLGIREVYTAGNYISSSVNLKALTGPVEFTADYSGTFEAFFITNNVTEYTISNFTIKEVGATLALEPEGIQPAPGQWLDSSPNKLHAWHPTTGSTIARKKTDFEIRGINTWTASHAAQSIAMTSDASRAMLPANCYIESIVGVVAGSDIEDIIIGNGSDTDYWVELTTGLAAGTVSFMLANRISDGTNYELVVDPDADCTMTITWTIKGYVLD